MSELDWQKSSFSGDQANCVEVRVGAGLVELRESDDGNVILHTNPAAFADLLSTIKAGKLDHHA
ncbi:DUF397 domain-containing protein [Kitasatospora purpeofusca]|uniref:DUF397 domain-containing protein n=1 Tax=Kitasatospora purpeofusca TaxID=67352 RepID=UPI00225811E3|nr:DUF397 domain-containing protein [Kitasatospora purpeofusca]MCX4753669.1 DUF397 domain-containing protein [Kitasatospora purpeofusca]WSR33156.1 DUF397 domain-containing protein [Kitasatospora purpeofusca]WSR41230.1 DUF397 domain-containing protein [Kitasatospora purpeofusca]